MSSESRLYTFSDATTAHLRKFRLTTSRSRDPQAVIYQIDKSTLEIHPSSSPDDAPLASLAAIADELPDNSPRYVLLSYPLTLPSGRQSVPYVMLNYLPPTCSNEMRVLYAGAKELMRRQSEVGRILEVESAEEVEGVAGKLKGEE